MTPEIGLRVAEDDEPVQLQSVEVVRTGGGGTTDYEDLENKPSINGVTLEGDNSASDLSLASASDVAAKYTKPSGGIPKSDLASTVQTSLGKADSAYQKPSGGIPASDLASSVQTSLGKADTALQSAPVSSVDGKTGSVTILPSGGSTGQVLKKASATDYAVEWANESGGGGGSSDYTDLTNKPSINSVTLSGNKTAADLSLASAADVAAKEDKVTEVTVSTAGAVAQALDAGKIYHFTGALTDLTITLNAAASGQIAHYHFDFDCGSTAPTVSIPNTVTMPDSNSFDASKHYEVDILNNYGAVIAWANS